MKTPSLSLGLIAALSLASAAAPLPLSPADAPGLQLALQTTPDDDPGHHEVAASPAEPNASPRNLRDVVQIGSPFHLKKGERATQVVVIFAPATIDGAVDRDVVVVGGPATVNGTVGGSLICPLGSAQLGPEAEVNRDVIVVGGDLTEASTAKIGGTRQEFAFAKFLPQFHWLTAWFKDGLLHGRPLAPRLGWTWVVAGVFLLVYLAFTLILPKPVQACVDTLEAKPIISFFTGLLVLVALGPLLVIMSVTVIGPLVLLVGYLAAAILGRIAVLCFLGQRLSQGLHLEFTRSPVASLVVGAVLITLLYLIPVLGLLVWLTLVPLALGATTVAAVIALQSSAAHRPRFAPAAVGALASPLATPGVSAPPLIPSPVPPSTAPAPADAGLAVAPTPLPGPETLSPTAPGEVPNPSLQGGPAFAVPATPPLTAMENLTLPRAGFWIRFLATFLDFIPLAMIIPLAGEAWILVWTGYHIGMWAWRGSTLGGIVLGLKLIRLDGREVDLPVALVRGLAAYFSLVVLFLGFFWAGWSRDKQSWHDKIAGTVAVKVPKVMSLI